MLSQYLYCTAISYHSYQPITAIPRSIYILYKCLHTDASHLGRASAPEQAVTVQGGVAAMPGMQAQQLPPECKRQKEGLAGGTESMT